MLAEILVALGLLFILVLILAPIYYYFQREKLDDKVDAADEGIDQTGAKNAE